MPTLYFIVGQAGWFACVLGAAHGLAWLGVTFAIGLIGLHLWRVARPAEEAKLLVSVVLMGAVWESAMIHLGLVTYPRSASLPGIAPLWLAALWGLFAAQINTTYRWLKRRILLAPLLGAIAGPVSFHAGAALGALRFPRPWTAAWVLAAGWAVLLPAAIGLSRHWDGVDREGSP